MKKYIGAALSLASVGMLFYILFTQKEQIKDLEARIKTLQTQTDSLDNQNTIIQHENDEMENAIDALIENDSTNAEVINEANHNFE
jgi:chaperonin cofactor prefoldin